jgi:hypothetical protein
VEMEWPIINNKAMETTNPTMKKLLRLTNSSQAKKSLKVAIELGTREKQVNNLFRKLWKLKSQYSTGYIKSIQG